MSLLLSYDDFPGSSQPFSQEVVILHLVTELIRPPDICYLALESGAVNVQEDFAPLHGALILSLMMQNLVFFLLLSHALYSSVDSQQCEHGAVKLVGILRENMYIFLIIIIICNK